MSSLSKLTDYRGQVTEGPIWHPDEHTLYWTDLQMEQLLRYDPKHDNIEIVCKDVLVGGFTIQADGSLLLFMDQGQVGVYRDGYLDTERISLSKVSTRFNDVIADPKGRVICGVMPDEDHPGGLYRLDTDGQFKCLLSRVRVPNGMGFSPDETTLYFTETNNRIIHAFDYDARTGRIVDRTTFAQFHRTDGKPDGLSVDEAGGVWSAQWAGHCIRRYFSNAEFDHDLRIPAKNVTSLAFGGENRQKLFITTARSKNQQSSETDGGGKIYISDCPVSGRPQYRSRVDWKEL